jgi:dephospho-CoA kinase
MPKIIAICGAKRSGKDVLAEHLIKNYNYEKIAFADPLKHVVKNLFNFDDDQVGIGIDTGTNRKDIIDDKWGITPRAALQFFGTEIMQEKIQELLPNIKKNFFANTLKNHIENAEKNKLFVISDLRFLHEYEMLFKIPNIHKDDIIIIRVVRPPSNSKLAASAASAASFTHISEAEYFDIPYDVVIVNNDTIDSYIKKFDKIMSI